MLLWIPLAMAFTFEVVQIRPFADSKKHIAMDASRNVTLAAGNSLSLNSRIFPAGKSYHIFVDGYQVCHSIETVVRCTPAMLAEQAWAIEQSDGEAYEIKAANASLCLTRRDGERVQVVMTACKAIPAQKWKISLDEREKIFGSFFSPFPRMAPSAQFRNFFDF